MSDDPVTDDDPGWLSPVDGHMHYAIKNRDGCAVCAIEDERDRLRAVVDAARDLLAGTDPWGTEGFILVSTPKLTALRELVELDVSANMGGLHLAEGQRRTIAHAIRSEAEVSEALKNARDAGHQGGEQVSPLERGEGGGSVSRQSASARPHHADAGHQDEAREAVVTFDFEAGAAYVTVRRHDTVARTQQVHDSVMLDYDDDGRLLGVEVLGIVADAGHQDEGDDHG